MNGGAGVSTLKDDASCRYFKELESGEKIIQASSEYGWQKTNLQSLDSYLSNLSPYSSIY